MLSDFLCSLTKDPAQCEPGSFIVLISQRYGISLESAKLVSADLPFEQVAILAGSNNDQVLENVVFSDSPIHTLPNPESFTDEHLVDRRCHLWFADCSTETFEWHCINNKETLLNTLLFRTKFLKDYLQNELSSGRYVDLLTDRGREDLLKVVGKHFPFIRLEI
jgi:hypothetical protein